MKASKVSFAGAIVRVSYTELFLIRGCSYSVSSYYPAGRQVKVGGGEENRTPVRNYRQQRAFMLFRVRFVSLPALRTGEDARGGQSD
jgi:hypothetical protein